jgi:hypothetical protein
MSGLAAKSADCGPICALETCEIRFARVIRGDPASLRSRLGGGKAVPGGVGRSFAGGTVGRETGRLLRAGRLAKRLRPGDGAPGLKGSQLPA